MAIQNYQQENLILFWNLPLFNTSHEKWQKISKSPGHTSKRILLWKSFGMGEFLESIHYKPSQSVFSFKNIIIWYRHFEGIFLLHNDLLFLRIACLTLGLSATVVLCDAVILATINQTRDTLLLHAGTIIFCISSHRQCWMSP